MAGRSGRFRVTVEVFDRLRGEDDEDDGDGSLEHSGERCLGNSSERTALQERDWLADEKYIAEELGDVVGALTSSGGGHELTLSDVSLRSSTEGERSELLFYAGNPTVQAIKGVLHLYWNIVRVVPSQEEEDDHDVDSPAASGSSDVGMSTSSVSVPSSDVNDDVDGDDDDDDDGGAAAATTTTTTTRAAAGKGGTSSSWEGTFGRNLPRDGALTPGGVATGATKDGTTLAGPLMAVRQNSASGGDVYYSTQSGLPLKRSELVLVLAVPLHMPSPEFCQWVRRFDRIKQIRIIKDGRTGAARYLVLMQFHDQLAADDFYLRANGVPFNSLDPEVCHVVFVAEVEFIEPADAVLFPGEDERELPTCPVCLGRLDAKELSVITSLCNHDFHVDCLAQCQMVDSSCPVCRYSQRCVDRSRRWNAASALLGPDSSAMDSPASAAAAPPRTRTVRRLVRRRVRRKAPRPSSDDSLHSPAQDNHGIDDVDGVDDDHGVDLGDPHDDASTTSQSHDAEHHPDDEEEDDDDDEWEYEEVEEEVEVPVEDEEDAAADDAARTSCQECGTADNLWICLLCGHVGCSRYQNEHARMHFEQTGHTYSLELETQRVWDYAGDGYVHRLIQSKGDGKIIKVGAPDQRKLARGKDPDQVENLAIEYNYLLTTQLESQREYFECQMEELQAAKDQEILELHLKVEEMVAGYESKLSKAHQERRQADQKLSKIHAKYLKCLQDTQQQRKEIEFLSTINDEHVANHEKWEEKVRAAQAETALKQEEIAELKAQVSDLMLHFQSAEVLANHPDADELDDEGVAVLVSDCGDPSVLAAEDPASAAARQRRKKRKNRRKTVR